MSACGDFLFSLYATGASVRNEKDPEIERHWLKHTVTRPERRVLMDEEFGGRESN